MGKPVRRFFCMQNGVVKRDDLDSDTPKRGSPYRFDKRNQYATLLQSRVTVQRLAGHEKTDGVD